MTATSKLDTQLTEAEEARQNARDLMAQGDKDAEIIFAAARIQIKKVEAAIRLKDRVITVQIECERLLRRLGEDGADFSVNSLGELQSQSAQLEAAVGALHMAQEIGRVIG